MSHDGRLVTKARLLRRAASAACLRFEDEMIEAVAAGTLDGAAVTPAAVGYFNMTHPNAKLALPPWSKYPLR